MDDERYIEVPQYSRTFLLRRLIRRVDSLIVFLWHKLVVGAAWLIGIISVALLACGEDGFLRCLVLASVYMVYAFAVAAFILGLVHLAAAAALWHRKR